VTVETKIKWLKRWSTIRVIPLVPLALMLPRNKRKVVFGSWVGKTFSCSPKYLMDYFARCGGFQCVWIGEKRLREEVLKIPNVRFAAKGSLAALWHMLTAKFYVYNVCWWTDLMRVPRCGRTILIYTSHGVPTKLTGIKQYDGNGRPVGRSSAGGLFARMENFMFGKAAWYSATSALCRSINLANFVDVLSADRMINCGTPRFDYLIHNRDNAELKKSLKQKYAKLLRLSPDERWFLYMPTWRHNPKDNFSFAASDKKSAYQYLLAKEKAVLIELHHFITLEQLWIKKSHDDRICIVSRQQLGMVDVQELVLACDRLITDFSSVYYDAYVAHRPIVHFAHDFERFMTQDMGFNYDFREFAGGPLANTEDELLGVLAKDDAELLASHGPRIDEILEYEKGNACQGYYDLVSALSEGRNPNGEKA